MRAEGPRRRELGKDDWMQAKFDSGDVPRLDEKEVGRREQEAVFEDIGGDMQISDVTEPLAIQAQRPPELKIVRGTPDSVDLFGETAMSKTLLQPKVRIVDDELRDSKVFVDDMKKIDDVRDRIKGMGSTNDKSSRKSA